MPQTHTPKQAAPDPILKVEGLSLTFETDSGDIQALNHIDLSLARGKTHSIVGESGSGKSVLSKAVLGILPKTARLEGKITYTPEVDAEPIDIIGLPRHGAAIRGLRGGEISMIFQEPMAALSPVHTIGEQIIEMIRAHRPMSKKEALETAVEALDEVGIPNPKRRIKSYPFQLSGGQLQRAMIAIALASHPKLLIADEPTTALDVTMQAQVLDLLADLKERRGMSLLFITHDLGVVAEISDDVTVMYLGETMERGDVFEIYEQPQHPYTQGLLASIQRLKAEEAPGLLATIGGSVPPPGVRPAGCVMHPRCPIAEEGVCDKQIPTDAYQADAGRLSRCHKSGQLAFGHQEAAHAS